MRGWKALLLHYEIESFNARYAQVLDEQRLADWTEHVHRRCTLYVVLSRENFDRGLPVGLIYCENKRMIHDRAFALMETSTVCAALPTAHSSAANLS